MKRLLTLALLLWLPCTATAEPHFRVATTGEKPYFIPLPTGKADGYCLDVWERCGKQLGFTSTYQTFADSESALNALQKGQVDAALGPLAITAERVQQMDFTVPYDQLNLAVLVRVRDASVFDRLRPFFNQAALLGSLLLIAVLLLVGLVIWLLERKRNPEHFHPDPRRGLEDGVWFAITTATTVGYGDRFPVTLRGRAVTVFWLLVSSVAFSTATALLSTALMLSHLPGSNSMRLRDLTGERLALVRGSVTESALTRVESPKVRTRDLDEAIQLLKDQRVDMVVSTTMLLNYHLHASQDEASLRVIELVGKSHFLCFALPKGSAWTSKFNSTLLNLSANGDLDRVSQLWNHKDLLGPEAANP